MKIYNYNKSQMLGYSVYDEIPTANIDYVKVSPREFRRGWTIALGGLALLGIGALVKIFIFG